MFSSGGTREAKMFFTGVPAHVCCSVGQRTEVFRADCWWLSDSRSPCLPEQQVRYKFSFSLLGDIPESDLACWCQCYCSVVCRVCALCSNSQRHRHSFFFIQQHWDSGNMLSHIVTGDKTWIHHRVNSLPPRKFHTQKLAGKVMARIFWDCKGVLLVDYFPHKTTMTRPYYGELLKRLHQAVKEKRRGMLTWCTLLLHDNALAHMSRVGRAVAKDIGSEQLSHPPYSTELTPSDFHLFQHLRGKRFCNVDEFKQATESYFDSMPQRILIDWMRDQCRKCVDVKGDCIEKWCSCFACVVCASYWIAKRFERPS